MQLAAAGKRKMSAIGKPVIEPSQRGFTLIEALVVAAITALLSSIMFPRLQGMITGQEFRTARSQMIMGVRETRALAIRSGAAARFKIEEAGHGFMVNDRTQQNLPASVRLSNVDTRGVIIFYSDGTSNGGRITLSSRDHRQEFLIFPTTGLIVEATR